MGNICLTMGEIQQATSHFKKTMEIYETVFEFEPDIIETKKQELLGTYAQWDNENRFDAIISDYLSHVTDEKPITARQCIKALAQVGVAKPQYIPRILLCLHEADLSKYKDSMRPLIKKDMAETERILTDPVF